LTVNGKPIFNFLVDSYTNMKKNNGNWEENTKNLDNIMLKRVSNEDTILNKLITNSGITYGTRYNIDNPYKYDYITVNDFNLNFNILDYSEEEFKNTKSLYKFSTNKDLAYVFGKKNYKEGSTVFNVENITCSLDKDKDFCDTLKNYAKTLDENKNNNISFVFNIKNDILYKYNSMLENVLKYKGMTQEDRKIINDIKKTKIYLSGLLVNVLKQKNDLNEATFLILKYSQDILQSDGNKILFVDKIKNIVSKDYDNLNNNIDRYVINYKHNYNLNGVDKSDSECKTEIQNTFKDITTKLENANDLKEQLKQIIRYVAFKTFLEKEAYMGDIQDTKINSMAIQFGKGYKIKNYQPIIFNKVYDWVFKSIMDSINKFQNVLIVNKPNIFTKITGGANINLIIGDTYSEVNNINSDKNGYQLATKTVFNNATDIFNSVFKSTSSLTDIIKIVIETLALLSVGLIIWLITFIILIITILQMFGYLYVIGIAPIAILWSLLLIGLPNKPEFFEVKTIVKRGMILMLLWVMWYIFMMIMLIIYKYGIVSIQEYFMINNFKDIIMNGNSEFVLFMGYISIVVLPSTLYIIILIISLSKFKKFMAGIGRDTIKEVVNENYIKSINFVKELSTLTKLKK